MWCWLVGLARCTQVISDNVTKIHTDIVLATCGHNKNRNKLNSSRKTTTAFKQLFGK